MTWQEFSIMNLPPTGFVLAYVEFDSASDPGAQPQMLIAYYSPHDGHWRTRNGRLRGYVTHWMPLPEPPQPEKRLGTLLKREQVERI
jgi:hypothetical protein